MAEKVKGAKKIGKNYGKKDAFMPNVLDIAKNPENDMRTLRDPQHELALKDSILKSGGLTDELKGHRSKIPGTDAYRFVISSAGNTRLPILAAIILGVMSHEEFHNLPPNSGVDLIQIPEDREFGEPVLEQIAEGKTLREALEGNPDPRAQAILAGDFSNNVYTQLGYDIPGIMSTIRFSTATAKFGTVDALLEQINSNEGQKMPHVARAKIALAIMEMTGQSQSQVAPLVFPGVTESAANAQLSNAMKLVNAPESVQTAMEEGKISEDAVIATVRQITKEAKGDAEADVDTLVEKQVTAAVKKAKGKKATRQHVPVLVSSGGGEEQDAGGTRTSTPKEEGPEDFGILKGKVLKVLQEAAEEVGEEPTQVEQFFVKLVSLLSGKGQKTEVTPKKVQKLLKKFS